MKDVELLGPRLRVRRARLADADFSYRWFADPVVTEYLPLAGERSLPMPDIREFLENAARDDDPSLSVGIELLSGTPIGCGGLRNVVAAESAEISVVIGEPPLWGLGYGEEAMRMLLRFGFEALALQRIWLVVRTDNRRGVAMFTRLGFVVTETMEAATIVRGTPRDKFRMDLTIDRWKSLQ